MADILSPTEEQRFLRGLLQRPDKPVHIARWSLSAKTGLWLAMVVAGIVALQVFGEPSKPVFVASLVGLTIGGLFGFFATANVFSRHILVVGQFVDRERIEARLRELGA